MARIAKLKCESPDAGLVDCPQGAFPIRGSPNSADDINGKKGNAMLGVIGRHEAATDDGCKGSESERHHNSIIEKVLGAPSEQEPGAKKHNAQEQQIAGGEHRGLNTTNPDCHRIQGTASDNIAALRRVRVIHLG